MAKTQNCNCCNYRCLVDCETNSCTCLCLFKMGNVGNVQISVWTLGEPQRVFGHSAHKNTSFQVINFVLLLVSQYRGLVKARVKVHVYACTYHSVMLLWVRMMEVSMSVGWYCIPLSSITSSNAPTTYKASCLSTGRHSYMYSHTY